VIRASGLWERIKDLARFLSWPRCQNKSEAGRSLFGQGSGSPAEPRANQWNTERFRAPA